MKVPRLRAMIATVRNLARAAFTTLGAVELCLLRSRSSPFRLFKLCSVQAMETCIASQDSARSSQNPTAQAVGRGRTVGGFLLSFNPSSPRSWMPSEEFQRLNSEPTEWQERLKCSTESQGPKEVNSRAGNCLSSWSADQPLQSSQAVISAD